MVSMISHGRTLLRRMAVMASFAGAAGASPLARLVSQQFLLPRRDLLRLGSRYGGWLIPRDAALDANSVCYLAGAGEDISFDCALVESYGVLARVVDPTPRAIEHFNGLADAVRADQSFPINNSASEFYTISPAQLARITYLPFGLAGADEEMKFYKPKDPNHVSCSVVNLQKTDTWFTAHCYRMISLMEREGDTKVDLLKMDIEGGEYAVLDDLVRTKLLPKLLLIEFDEAHSPLDDHETERIAERVHALERAGLRCIAVDGSNVTFRRAD